MNLVFIGPPYAGKGTQTDLLSKSLEIPVYSMGALIRDAFERRDPHAVEGYENYTLKGQHVPTNLKFKFLEDKLNDSPEGFIIDNFPATAEDLQIFNEYLEKNGKKIDSAIHLWISEEEMKKRRKSRGRDDDDPEIVKTRREAQDEDRIPVIEYYKKQGTLIEINEEGDIQEVNRQIMDKLRMKNE
mgnify:FL=1